MLTAALALASAIVYGAGDFLGGMATRVSRAEGVVLLSQVVGLLTVLPAIAVTGGRLDPLTLGWGAAAGVAGVVAVTVFYGALARGSMSVIAPVTAVAASGTPVLVGVLLGERPSGLATSGVVLALVAVVLVSAEGGRLPTWSRVRADGQTLAAVAAGLGFGLVFVLVSRAPDSSGLWSLAVARVVSVSLMVSFIGAQGLRPLLPAPGARLLALVAGIADMAANVLFLEAERQGSLVVAGSLSSLYPASTVLLALVVLRERLFAVQVVGVATTLVAAAMISSG